MALPKEPRQKMINIMYLVLTAILALNVSAEILNAFKTVRGSLDKSSQSIEVSNTNLFEQLAAKLSKPESAEKAKIWEPQAQSAKKYSETLYSDIETLKDKLKRAAGFNPEKGDTSFNESDLEAATRVFITQGEGKSLLTKLTKLKSDLLTISPEIGREFQNKLPIDLSVPKSQSGNSNNSWEYNYFHMTPTIAALTMLSKFQNDIKNSENQIVTYCNNQINSVVLTFDRFKPLISQSSNYVMPGQKVTIQAGVGAFSSASAPQVSIGGQSVSASEGYGQVEFTAAGAGVKTVPVHIVFKDQNGKEQVLDEKVEYTVGVPSGAAVMLDKMNVFYIGVDNPVTISSGSGWDKTQVSMAGGTLSGSGSNRIVRVTAPGTASITVTADGKTSKFDFRVKRIPDPIIKVGPSGGGRMQAVVFRSQQFVRADLEAFDFEAKYNVTGATVYFNNPGDRNVKSVSLSSGSLAPAKAFMDQLVPGSTVTFDNIRVVGPDGQTRTIQNPPGFSLF
ncbi:MAG: gliding motility protein GldM [Ferruginibacter sp.]